MDSLPARIRTALGNADITGWAYQILPPGNAGDICSATQAVQGRIGDKGNIRMLFEVSLDNLDPQADADACQLLAGAAPGQPARLRSRLPVRPSVSRLVKARQDAPIAGITFPRVATRITRRC